ncbi:hypothetical protein [Synechococcus sp. BDU 130192]|uniref:hypothetical protein n=1 Tax=Synechococcus sp. BDU 130192 TaxID=2042059 RepID=UPI000C06B659|nr:hypothetical protein [Synechococcus sp. BDU 130192]
MKIIILALRRSGSTIFWQCFREATNARCFDEPFNPKIFQIPQEHSKGNLKEFIDLLKTEGELFWQLFDPIYPQEELKKGFTAEQNAYLTKLLSLNEDVVIDSTRCWNKISALGDITDSDTFLIHLHRAPASWITSHLLPSEEKKYLLLNLKRKKTFWTRKIDFNRWNMEDILGRELLSPFHSFILKDAQLTEYFYRAPAVYRLMKFWALVFQEVESTGRKVFGKRFISVHFEDFCIDPINTLGLIGSKTGLCFDFKKLPSIRLPSPAFMNSNENWQQAAQYWELPDDIHYLFRDNV